MNLGSKVTKAKTIVTVKVSSKQNKVVEKNSKMLSQVLDAIENLLLVPEFEAAL